MRSKGMDRAKRGLALGAVLTTAACGLAVAAPGAGAVQVLACGGSSTNAFSPGLTNTPSPVILSFTANYQPCVNALDPLEFRTGRASGASSVPVLRSCTDLLVPNHLTRTITWSTGTTSTWEFDSTSQYANGQLVTTSTGSIVAGEFSGSTAIGVTTFVASLTACSSRAGLTQIGGPTTLRIVL